MHAAATPALAAASLCCCSLWLTEWSAVSAVGWMHTSSTRILHTPHILERYVFHEQYFDLRLPCENNHNNNNGGHWEGSVTRPTQFAELEKYPSNTTAAASGVITEAKHLRLYWYPSGGRYRFIPGCLFRREQSLW